MSGVHVVQRTTNLLNRNIVKAQSSLVLPSAATYRANTTPGVHGAFPEFIHGFYSGGYGFDAGIMYKDGSFWLFFGGFDNTGAWAEKILPTNSAALGKTVVFETHFTSTGYVSISSQIGSYSTSLLVKLTTNAYNTLKNGCKFVREMVIAINKESNGSTIILPTGASFSVATFGNTDLWTNSGVQEALSSNISSAVVNLFDSDTDDTTYDGSADWMNSENYMHDRAMGSI